MKNDKPRSVLGLVFLTVFLDIVGFSIIFPLFPSILEHYLALEGDGSAIGRLVAWLEGFAGEDERATQTLFGGVLGSIYSILQFGFAPVWGALSDRIGRRSTLLFTLGGTFISYVLWVFAGSFGVLIAARILGGAMAGNIATASAAVADSTTGTDRAKGMGIVGMAIGLGFVLGPALGALGWAASPESLAAIGEAPAGILALNPFSVCAGLSLLLATLNWIWVAKRLPETLPPEKRGKSQSKGLNPFNRLGKLPFPGVRRANLLYFCFLLAFGAMEFTLTFLAADRFDYDPTDNGKMFVFIGLTIALVQGGVVRRLAPKLGEKKVALAGLILTLPGFLLIGYAPADGGLLPFYIGLFCTAAGSALVMPCTSALVSRYVPEDRQGYSQGVLRSMGSLSRAIGPVLGGVLYWKLGSASPYWIGAAALLVPIVMALGLPPIPSGEPQRVAADPA